MQEFVINTTIIIIIIILSTTTCMLLFLTFEKLKAALTMCTVPSPQNIALPATIINTVINQLQEASLSIFNFIYLFFLAL